MSITVSSFLSSYFETNKTSILFYFINEFCIVDEFIRFKTKYSAPTRHEINKCVLT